MIKIKTILKAVLSSFSRLPERSLSLIKIVKMADWNKKSKNECWKSSVNRFCKYCKCWVADNKASWAGHEQGSRHKKAVEDKLMEMKRQAVMTQKHGQVGHGIRF